MSRTGTMTSNVDTVTTDKIVIWRGILEISETHAIGPVKNMRQIPCKVLSSLKNSEAEVSNIGWPSKLMIQFMPKSMVAKIDSKYILDSKPLLFQLSNKCSVVMKQVMRNGLACSINFPSTNESSVCPIKVIILLYSVDRDGFYGFVPNDHNNFILCLREVIIQESSQQGNGEATQTSEESQRQQSGSNEIIINRPEIGNSTVIQEDSVTNQRLGGQENICERLNTSQQQEVSYCEAPQFPIPEGFFPIFRANRSENVSTPPPTPSPISQGNNNSGDPHTNGVKNGSKDGRDDIKAFISKLFTQQEKTNAASHKEMMTSINHFRSTIENFVTLLQGQQQNLNFLSNENALLRAKLYGNYNNSNNANNNQNQQSGFQSWADPPTPPVDIPQNNDSTPRNSPTTPSSLNSEERAYFFQ